jgi:hypothetical protein
MGLNLAKRLLYRKTDKLVWNAMVIRIRFGKGPIIGRRHGTRRAATVAAALLTPLAALAFILACWRITADLDWTGGFAIPTGFFSHWQVWTGAAILLQLCSRVLNRYGRSDGAAAS